MLFQCISIFTSVVFEDELLAKVVLHAKEGRHIKFLQKLQQNLNSKILHTRQLGTSTWHERL